MTERLPPYGSSPDNLVAFTTLLDTHLLDKGEEWGDRLRALAKEGWFAAGISDTVLTEVQAAQNVDKRQDLLERVGLYVITLGVARWDHTSWDAAVWGTPQDEERFARVYEVLWPGHDRLVDGGDAGSSTGRTRFRDAMHVDTAIRYGFDAFVTEDRRVLDRAKEIHDRFMLRVMSAREAVIEVAERLAAHRRLYELDEQTYELPEWPTATEIEQWLATS